MQYYSVSVYFTYVFNNWNQDTTLIIVIYHMVKNFGSKIL